MSEDMSNLINKFSSMLKNNEIPPELSNIMNNISNSNSSNNDSKNTQKKDISSNISNSKSENNIDASNNINFENIKKIFEQNSNSSSTQDNNEKKDNSFNFDINTMLKMKSIIDAMNSQKDDPRANLLKSLKPYLKESRKEKVDQYIKIFSMEKVFEQLNPLGGDKKNDV